MFSYRLHMPYIWPPYARTYEVPLEHCHMGSTVLHTTWLLGELIPCQRPGIPDATHYGFQSQACEGVEISSGGLIPLLLAKYVLSILIHKNNVITLNILATGNIARPWHKISESPLMSLSYWITTCFFFICAALYLCTSLFLLQFCGNR